MDNKNADKLLLGKRMIETAINLDESLVDLLKIETRRLKQIIKEKNNFEEVQKTIKLVRNIIIVLTLTDEKIKTGLELYHESDR